jgi:S-DNA-T family DNA segregation ATPase FtsK/SpoIIIE|tara:strand:- start:4219 stop:6306 length:2088 start_codon:yes stop_codon:yes gene_type:complete
MKFANFLTKTKEFLIKRISELLGLLIIFLALSILISLVSYSPNDPNFIISETDEIQNLLGFRGSVISDFLFQSIGLISYCIPFTLFFSGANILLNKRQIILIDNLFFCVLYIICGSLFFAYFKDQSFFLTINGNGGFIGLFLKDSFIASILEINHNVSYYTLLILTFFLFLISINFKMSQTLNYIGFIKNLFLSRKNTNIKENDNTIIENVASESLNEDRRVQDSLPFNNKVDMNIKKFILPDLKLLKSPSENEKIAKKNEDINEDFLEKVLMDFGVEGKIKKINYGPVVTLYEFEPAAGIKVSKIINLSEDIARNTSSESARISIIPGSNTIGIELPNFTRENVYLGEVIRDPQFKKKDIKLPIALGKSISGNPIIGDLSTMPHLLIAGTTGSGKSICVNTIILSLLYRHTPDKCKFILIDPKMLELSTYEGIPHLLCPVITEAKKAASVLGWVVKEMENRYKLMTKVGVRNIDGYNSKHKTFMPYIVVIVDEMSDLMLVSGKDIENYIQKLSQMARAAGIHIIMATQRPSVDVITGTIKANFPTRISFQVSSKIDSRTILGEQGAEQLLGKGDMLYMSSANRITRIHAPFVAEDEIEKINNFLRSQAEPNYVEEILEFSEEVDNKLNNSEMNDKDELYQSALKLVKNEGKASTSFLQRKLQIGYNRAARIIDMMEENGVVSKANHVGKREILQ